MKKRYKVKAIKVRLHRTLGHCFSCRSSVESSLNMPQLS